MLSKLYSIHKKQKKQINIINKLHKNIPNTNQNQFHQTKRLLVYKKNKGNHLIDVNQTIERFYEFL